MLCDLLKASCFAPEALYEAESTREMRRVCPRLQRKKANTVCTQAIGCQDGRSLLSMLGHTGLETVCSVVVWQWCGCDWSAEFVDLDEALIS